MKKRVLCGALVALLTGLQGRANDAGGLVYPIDYPHRARAELMYERVQRGVEITSETPNVDADLDADVFALRLHTGLGQYARLDFDLGGMSAGRGSYSFMGGVGLRYLAFEHEAWRGGAFGQVRYAPDLSDQMNGPGATRSRVSYDLTEADAGFLAAYRTRVAEGFTVTPYAGPVLSILRLSGRARDEAGVRRRFRADEDRLLGVAAGLSFEFRDMNGIRIEARYFDDISLSAAAALVF